MVDFRSEATNIIKSNLNVGKKSKDVCPMISKSLSITAQAAGTKKVIELEGIWTDCLDRCGPFMLLR